VVFRALPFVVVVGALLGPAAAIADPVSNAPAAAAVVELFSPQGETKQVRQVTARFSAPMVALGDPRLPDPFERNCHALGNGRWADARNWVYDFDQDLPAGIRCAFTVRKDLKALNGAAVEGQLTFEINTGGPAVVGSYPRDGSREIDEEQVFLLKLDAPATVGSVKAHVYCAVEGLGEKIPVEVLTGEDRTAILRNRKLFGYQYFQLLWKSGDVSNIRVRDPSIKRAEANITVLRCQRRLPPAARVLIRWGAGVRAATGPGTTHEQQLNFQVRSAFTAQVECTRANARAGCMPMLPVTVRFNAAVPRSLALAVRLKLSDGTELQPVAPAQSGDSTLASISFAGPFPALQPATILLPPNLVDDAGRVLANASRFPLEIRVDDYPPLAKFSGTFGILEAKEGGVLPVTLRNLEPQLVVRQAAMPGKLVRLDNDPATIAQWLRRVDVASQPKGEMVAIPKAEQTDPSAAKPKMASDDVEADGEEGEGEQDATHRWREDTGAKSVFESTDATTTFEIAKPEGPKAFEVVGIPLKDAGFYVVELESRILGQSLLGRDQVRYVATAALVTNLAVHFKLGRESSAVWVTRLDDGTPVAGADVIITEYCNGAALWHGRTGKDGIAAVGTALGAPRGGYCSSYGPGPLMVSASKDGDFSFVLDNWNKGIDPFQFGLPSGSEYNARIFHTVFDRPLFRAGETVSMKHFLRRHEMDGFGVPEDLPGKRTVTIAHPESGQQYKLEVTFDRDGIAESEWKIPAEAKLGRYEVSIEDGKQQRQSGEFKVEQFRLPSMHASVTGAAEPLVRAKTAEIDLHVAYMSGGGAPGIPVKLRTLVEPRPIHWPDYEDYVFDGKPVVEGVVTNDNGPQEYEIDADAESETTTETRPTKTQVIPLTLDATGSVRVTVKDLPEQERAAQLTAEIEYSDANGEILTSSGHVRLMPSTLSVGIRREGWAGSSEQVRFRMVVVDLKGKPQPHQAVKALLYQSNAFTYRKRLIGGFYAYETARETRKLAATCEGETDTQGLIACEVAPGATGEVLIRAETRDSEGRLSGATVSVWVADKDEWWFGGTSGDRMDVLPEKKAYESGETARFQVRMPFREATALVTVEREGVMSSFVTHLQGKEPIVEVPIAGNYAPNVFVSVLAVRGRVAHAERKSADSASAPIEEISALVDLNKPAFRLGIAAVKVGWKPHRLDVHVTTERSTYKVREHAPISIRVVRDDGAPLPPGTEVAIAAVDQALLDLMPNRSWNLLAAMMGERGIEVSTATAEMQVVGKRHYGRKAVPSGGSGGQDRTRELFDSLLYWKARVALDANGEAKIDIPLNDSLTEFKIVAIASGARGLFGTGSTTINSTQELIVLSGLPPLVREGDQYLATFTVRNTSDRAIPIEMSGSFGTTALTSQRLDLAAGQSRDVSWQVSAPLGQPSVQWEVLAHAVGGTAGDKLRVKEAVIPAYPVRTYQATITQLNGPYTLPVRRPAGAIVGRGGIDVGLRARLGDSLDGVREFASLYPYTCIEQQISNAIILGDKPGWDRLMQRLPAFMDADGLLRFFPAEWLPGDDSLTAYVLAIAQEAGWEVAEPTKGKLIEALKKFVAGRIVRGSALPTADLSIRKLTAIEALSRYGMAERSMLDSITVEPNLWPTSAVLDWLGILQRVSGIAQTEVKRASALNILRARLNFQGTSMAFSTESSDALWWLMISADSNANRMLLAALNRPEWRADVPRLVRGTLGRQRRGHWNTTVANAWGALAMEKFSAAFESVPVTGTAAVRYGSDARSVAWSPASNSIELSLPWQDGQGQVVATHTGTGSPWALLRATAALPLDKPLSTGFKIKRVVTPVEQQQPGRWTRGDVMRVRLELETEVDMSWVVVDDPVPAGSSILGSGLGGQSKLLVRDEHKDGRAWAAYEERRFDAFRAYYRYVPKGAWTVEYTVRLNNPGIFLEPATRVEAMYAPEMFGELPNAAITVERKP
jgi:uncharacterized protein YfaS (alpha-2-macroglobulin family)